jgi:hypothetical protein
LDTIGIILVLGVIVSINSGSSAKGAAQESLLNAAKLRFSNDLTIAEEGLMRAAKIGEGVSVADLSNHADPATGAEWPKERTIRADRLLWLCTDPVASTLVNYRGIHIVGARIEGTLNLRMAKVPFAVSLEKCSVIGNLLLEQSELRLLKLDGTHLDSLWADEAKMAGTLFLRKGFKARGELRLLGAAVGGDLDGSQMEVTSLIAERATFKGSVYFKEAKFHGIVDFANAEIGGDLNFRGATVFPGGSINANQAKIDGTVYFIGASLNGEVAFTRAKVANDFNCAGARFSNVDETALNLLGGDFRGNVLLSRASILGTVLLRGTIVGDNLICSEGYFENTTTNQSAFNATTAKITGDVIARKAEFYGQVRFDGAAIGGNFVCSGTEFINASSDALTCNLFKVDGDVNLSEGFRARGTVRLHGASVGGSVGCHGGHFTRPDANSPVAFDAQAARIAGSMFFQHGFTAEGEMRLIGATVHGTLEFDGGLVSNTNGLAIAADGMTVGMSAYLRDGFKARGGVRLFGGTIGGNLELSAASFEATGTPAIIANQAKIGRILLLNRTSAAGEVSFVNVEVGGDMNCHAAQLNNAHGTALNLRGSSIRGSIFLTNGFFADGIVNLTAAKVGGYFEWRGITNPSNTKLYLNSATFGTLIDEEASWPKRGNLSIDGLVYERISAPYNARTRIKWLSLSDDSSFLPQPFEQLAATLRAMGHEADADEVMIAKNNHRPGMRWWLFGTFAGYGYRPLYAFLWSVLFVLLSTAVFYCAYRCRIIAPTDLSEIEKHPESYPGFSALIYSLQKFVPLLDLEIAKHWRPNPAKGRRWVWHLSVPMYRKPISVDSLPSLLPVTSKAPKWVNEATIVLRRHVARLGVRKLNIGVTAGQCVLLYLWAHVFIGWILTALWIGSFTKLIKV